MPSEFGTTNRCWENRTLKTGLFLQFFEPGLGFTVEDEQWFSYRKRNRERPIIGDRRPPSPLGNIQPDHWLAEYTTELINVLNVLGCLVDLEPAQAALLEMICSDPTITAEELRAAGALELPAERKQKSSQAAHADLFSTPAL